jgi:uroporphyrinogen decarboxylase
MSITPRANLLKLWKRQGFDYIPVQFSLCPSLVEEFKKRYGTDKNYAEFFNFSDRGFSANFIKQQTTDWNKFYTKPEYGPEIKFDIWGVGHEPQPGSMHMTRMYHPMRDFNSIEQFQAYPYPEFNESEFSDAQSKIDEIHEQGFAASACMACTIWEVGWYMRSMEEFMMDMMTCDEKAVYHLDRLTELACKRAAAFAATGLDHIHFGDDIGMQHSIMMSEELYREWLKPRFAQVVKAAKTANPDIIVSYHSCGYVEPFIPDLIEVGVDVLNPVQPECMSFEKIHAEYGDVLSFWGTIGTQTTMPFGSPDDVRKEVIKNLKIAGAKGGLLCTPTHLLEPEVPWENIEAYIDACKNFSL